MQSFIIASKNKQTAINHAISFCQKRKIDKFDVDLNVFEKSAGIDDVRLLQKKLYLKPINGMFKAVILQVFEGATIQAQNSLLKILEEPPASTFIILIAQSKEVFLPTILSRCRIIELRDDSRISKEESAKCLNILLSMPQKGTGERLKIAQDLSKEK